VCQAWKRDFAKKAAIFIMMDFLNALENMQFSVWVRESGSIWAFPMFLFLHTLGMSIVAGGAAITSLALLGFWPKTALKPMEKMIPMMWAAFWLNAITGTVLLMADATTKLTNPDFGVKMIFVFAGTYIFYKMQGEVFNDPQLDNGPTPAKAKVLAWASLACWFGAIVAGRLLAYVGPVSGLQGVSN
jgi:hypothetical protein